MSANKDMRYSGTVANIFDVQEKLKPVKSEIRIQPSRSSSPVWLTVFYAGCLEHSDKRGLYRVWQVVPYLRESVENLFFFGDCGIKYGIYARTDFPNLRGACRTEWARAKLEKILTASHRRISIILTSVKERDS